ncbi:sensor histidine kinase [Microbacterium sp. GXS0129]|uniref:sensor histidine kinase n=1 Tax=Microbacterium sp. GXS0129 TaxID=3377836 RepID=UPI00383BF3D5
MTHRPSRARLWWALLPLGIGVLAALVLIATRTNAVLVLSLPFATLALALSVVASIVWAAAVMARGARKAIVARAVSEAEAASRAERARFLRRLDHEVKNPVTAIRTGLATGDAAALTVARVQSERLSSLVADLAKLAELETRPLERESVDLEALARDAVEAVAGRHPQRSYRVEFARVPWPVPAVSGDPDLLAVAVYNLVGNAAKYSDPGATVEVRGTEHDGIVTVEVADTGWGIPAEEVDGVWDDLARGSNARAVEGTGLGLAVVRVIARRHGGDVSLRSQQGQGTRVVLTVPVR